MKSIWNKECFTKNTALFKNRFPSLFEIFSPVIKQIEELDFEVDGVWLSEAGCGSLETGGRFTPEDFFSFWKTSVSPRGFPCAEENGLKLHSAYNPEKEAEGLLSAVCTASSAHTPSGGTSEKNAVPVTQALVFEGVGLGYAVLQASRKTDFSDIPFIICEPSPLHFFASLAVFDWSEVFAHPSLIIALTDSSEQAVKLINQYPVLNTVFISVPAWKSHAASFFAELEELVKRNREKEKINQATTKKFGYLWNRNCVRNARVSALLDDAGIYRNMAENNGAEPSIPFLLVAAGPSLREILPYLKDISRKCVIVAVDTALRVLVKNGCQPDFVLLTDPQYYAYRHLAGVSSPDSVLVTVQEAYPAVFRENFRKIVCARSQMPVGRFFEEKIKGKLAMSGDAGDDLSGDSVYGGLNGHAGEVVSDSAGGGRVLHFSRADLGSGGSVASCAWNFCLLCGAKKIYLSGLDLAFPQKQTHIKGSTFEQKAHSSSSRLESAETKSMPSYFSGNLTEGKDYLGRPVYTDSRMKMFAWWFESRFAECPEIENLTLSPEGLCIPGVKVSGIEALLSEKDIAEEKRRAFERAEGYCFDGGREAAPGTNTTVRKAEVAGFDGYCQLEKAVWDVEKELEKRLSGISMKDFDAVKKALL